LVLEWV